MRLNLGCGQHKREGYVNVDREPACRPDRVVDLESFPWPFDDDCAEEILMNHVLEHLGAETRVFFGVIKELYRIAAPDAILRVNVPHPRHDSFISDPTHVRIVTPGLFSLLSKRLNRDWAEIDAANTPLGLYLDVDFELESTELVIEQAWLEKLSVDGTPDVAQVQQACATYNNVASEYKMIIRAVK